MVVMVFPARAVGVQSGVPFVPRSGFGYTLSTHDSLDLVEQFIGGLVILPGHGISCDTDCAVVQDLVADTVTHL
jgi:hypothetical protein